MPGEMNSRTELWAGVAYIAQFGLEIKLPGGAAFPGLIPAILAWQDPPAGGRSDKAAVQGSFWVWEGWHSHPGR